MVCDGTPIDKAFMLTLIKPQVTVDKLICLIEETVGSSGNPYLAVVQMAVQGLSLRMSTSAIRGQAFPGVTLEQEPDMTTVEATVLSEKDELLQRAARSMPAEAVASLRATYDTNPAVAIALRLLPM